MFGRDRRRAPAETPLRREKDFEMKADRAIVNEFDNLKDYLWGILWGVQYPPARPSRSEISPIQAAVAAGGPTRAAG